MLWNWNTVDSCFISESWHVTSRGMFAGSCVGVILLVMTLEALRRSVKEFDRYLIRKHAAAAAAAAAPAAASQDAEPSPKSCAATAPCFAGFRPTIFEQAIRALLHMFQFAVAYFVMLYVDAVMFPPMTTVPFILTSSLLGSPCTITDTSSFAYSSAPIWALLSSSGRPLARGKTSCSF